MTSLDHAPARPRRGAAPRPGRGAARSVSDRAARIEAAREAVGWRRPLPGVLLSAARACGAHPWAAPTVAAGLGVVSSLVMASVPMLTVSVLVVVFLAAVLVVATASVIRGRYFSGARLRPEELSVDVDQAIPSAGLAPVLALVAWMLTTLLH